MEPPNEDTGLTFVFAAYDKPPDGAKPSFDVRVVGARRPSEFIGVGDLIPATRFRIQEFIFRPRQKTPSNKWVDPSMLKVLNTVTNEIVLLPLGEPVHLNGQ